jgi:Flp pilus assembly pilin Flp
MPRMSPANLQARLAQLRSEEAGQTLIEYAGMVLLLAIGSIVILAAVGLDLAELFDAIENKLGLGAGNTIDTTPGTDDAASAPGVV